MVAVTELGIFSVMLLKILYKLSILSAVMYLLASEATSVMNLLIFAIDAPLSLPLLPAASKIPSEYISAV